MLTLQQMKSVQRYQKRLEYHLSQVEDLLDQYSLHQKLREGVSIATCLSKQLILLTILVQFMNSCVNLGLLASCHKQRLTQI